MAFKGDSEFLAQVLGSGKKKRVSKGARGARPRRRPGEMNSLEGRYANQLEADRLAGLILWFEFEAVKLRLADKTFYSPDFLVLKADLSIEVHEVKGGHWEDDARVKIKVAAEKYPFRFVAVTRGKSGWVFEVIPGVE